MGKINYISVKIISFVFPAFIFLISACSDNSIDPSVSPIDEYTQVDFEPAWSSDANRIAYVHSNIDNKLTGIYVINSNGTNNIQIINDFAGSPCWSADDNWIAYSQFENIFKIKTGSDSIVQLTSGGKNYFPKWRMDDSLIAFSNSLNNSDYRIFTMKPDGSEKTLIDNNANYPGWKDVNSLIYFKPIYAGGSQSGDTLVQYFLNSNSMQVVAVLTGNEYKVNMYPVFAGDAIIFCSMDNRGSVFIYSMQPDGSSIQKLTGSQSYSPDYSFINQKIIYTNRTKGNGRLWTMNKNGSNKTQLTF